MQHGKLNDRVTYLRLAAGGWRLIAHYPKYPNFLLWVIAGLSSLNLTQITLSSLVIPGDWARLDQFGIYIPNKVDYPWPSYAVQVALWAGMIGCLVVLARRRTRHASSLLLTSAFYPTLTPPRIQGRAIRRPDSPSPPMERGLGGGVERKSCIYYFSVVGLTLLAFGLRLHAFNRLPLIIDEIGFAAWGSDMLHGQHIPIFAPGHNGNPAVYSWLVAGSMSLFGQNTFAIRLIPLVFGTLSIPAMYVLGRAWWTQRVGLLAAAFLATYPAHIHFSQLSMYNMVDPFFAMLALGILGSQSSAKDWLMAGILAGVAQYFYHGSRLLIILIVVYIIATLIRIKTLRASESVSLCVKCFGAFMIVSLPRFAPMIASGLPATGNLEGIRLPDDLAANSLRSVLAWVGQPDISPFWLGSGPLLEWPALIAFGIGLFICLRNWHDARHLVLMVSLVLTTLFGGVIWAAAPLYIRYMTAVPAIALLVGIGLAAINPERKDAKGQRRKGLVLMAFVSVICVHGVYVSLVQHPAEAYARISQSQWIEDDQARRAAELPEGIAVILKVPGNFNAIQMITIAHYIAALGQRRAVAVNRGGDVALLEEQIRRLGEPYVVIEASP